MLQQLPTYISVVFVLTTLVTLFFFTIIIKQAALKDSVKNMILGISVLWLILHGILAYQGVYSTDTQALPPRFIFVLGPVLILMISLFFFEKGKNFMDSLSLIPITYLNVVRIPVELVLYWLFLNKAVPELMTFAGRNFDILAGITAPLVAYFGIQQKMLGRKGLLIWNVICLGLLFFIVGNAILAAPFPFQQFAFDQPNIGVLHFPFIWLPAFIVPVVMFGHFVSIRQLTLKKEKPEPSRSTTPAQAS